MQIFICCIFKFQSTQYLPCHAFIWFMSHQSPYQTVPALHSQSQTLSVDHNGCCYFDVICRLWAYVVSTYKPCVFFHYHRVGT